MNHKLIATTQKSYYGKAIVKENGYGSILQSYDTDVCRMYKGSFNRLWNGYSVTTMKHINDYRLENGLKALSKKEWLALPCENNERYGVGVCNGFMDRKTSVIFDNYEDAEKYADTLTDSFRSGYVFNC